MQGLPLAKNVHVQCPQETKTAALTQRCGGLTLDLNTAVGQSKLTSGIRYGNPARECEGEPQVAHPLD